MQKCILIKNVVMEIQNNILIKHVLKSIFWIIFVTNIAFFAISSPFYLWLYIFQHNK